MGRNRFVQPDIVRLNLSDGDYIDIKKELNAGETRRVFGRLVKDMRAGEAVMLEPEQVGLTKISEYVVGWSFTDADGRPVDVSEGANNNLDQETYKEIADAIDAHEAKITAEREARKNATTGTRSSEAISVSAAS
jgi:hypothetical protein